MPAVTQSLRAVDSRAGLRYRRLALAVVAAANCIVLEARGVARQDVPRTGWAPDKAGLLVQRARTVRFRVTEGTWMSIDVSPDGRTIVFDLLGDLYTVPITGGSARRLTSGPAINRQPRYSPDGGHLVFVSDRGGSPNLWVADGDGRNARQLSRLRHDVSGAVASPTWSPDGRSIVASQKLAATRAGPVSPSQAFRWLLAAYDVETGRMRWVSDTSPDRLRAALGPAFGSRPDAVYAAVDASPTPSDVWSLEPHWRVALVNLATGGVRREMPIAIGRDGMRPAVSPDERYLVYVTSSGSHLGFRMRDLRTNREQWLLREVLNDPPLYAGTSSHDLVPGYAFTPDSKSLVSAYGGKIHRIDLSTGRASIIPFVADVERGLGRLRVQEFALPETAVRTRSVMQPALSPDGRSVAFSALDRIWIMELSSHGLAGGRPRRLTEDTIGEFYPSWSPDGRWIAYSTWADGEGGAVRRASVTVHSAGSLAASEQLTADTALYFHTAVAPDGERVLAVRAALPLDRALTWNSASDPALVWVPIVGGVPRVITSLAGEHFGPYVYPVDQVYFVANQDRVYVGLTSWQWDGTDRQTAVAVSGLEDSFEPYSVAGVVSSDGRRALITRKYTLFELGLPPLRAGQSSTLDLEQVRNASFHAGTPRARRWGTALAPWISWSHNGRRVLFNQGGSLFVGDVRPGRATTFVRIDVPLMIPIDEPRGTLVLHGARLITMRGREVIERGDVVVHDGRIVGVGAAGQVTIPAGARVLDASGTTVLPGYVDLHDHMALPRGVHPQQCWQCLARLAYGVTAARDPNPDGATDVFAYREREWTGELVGPRVFSTGVPYFGTDPAIQTIDDAREAVRPNAEDFGSQTFKIYGDPSAGRRASQLLIEAAAQRGLNATAHTWNLESVLQLLIDGSPGLEHAPQTRLYDDLAMLVARSGTTYTQTYGMSAFGAFNYMFHRLGEPWNYARMRQFVPPTVSASISDVVASVALFGPLQRDNVIPLVSGAARIAAKGGRVGMGSHGNIPGLGYHYEMWLHALGGMSNHEILRSATIIGSTAIGHARSIGSLESGKLADLQVLDQNPLDNIHHTISIRYVMKSGRLYEAEDLAEIWPRDRDLDAMYLWEPSRRPASTGTPARPKCRSLSGTP